MSYWMLELPFFFLIFQWFGPGAEPVDLPFLVCAVDLSRGFVVTLTKGLVPSPEKALCHWGIPGGRWPEMAGGWTGFLTPQKTGKGFWLQNGRQEEKQEYGENIISPKIPTDWLDSPFNFFWSLGAMLNQSFFFLFQRKSKDILMISPEIPSLLSAYREENFSLLTLGDKLFLEGVFFFSPWKILVK